MKNVAIFLLIVSAVCLPVIRLTGATYVEDKHVAGFTLATANWEQPRLELRLDDYNLIFSLQHVAGYATVDYSVTYTREGGIGEKENGSLDNSSGQDELTSPEIYLGTCSSGVCVPHEASDISVEVTLTNIGGEQLALAKNL